MKRKGSKRKAIRGRSTNVLLSRRESQVDRLHEQLLKHFANVREANITPAEARRRAKCSDQMMKAIREEKRSRGRNPEE
jgi:hypothetical protein